MLPLQIPASIYLAIGKKILRDAVLRFRPAYAKRHIVVSNVEAILAASLAKD
jgi:hypothetical protein